MCIIFEEIVKVFTVKLSVLWLKTAVTACLM